LSSFKELELRAGRWLMWVSVSCSQRWLAYQITLKMSKHKEEVFITSSQAGSWDEGFAPEQAAPVPLVMVPSQEPR
jgi:hypothetical protein